MPLVMNTSRPDWTVRSPPEAYAPPRARMREESVTSPAAAYREMSPPSLSGVFPDRSTLPDTLIESAASSTILPGKSAPARTPPSIVIDASLPAVQVPRSQSPSATHSTGSCDRLEHVNPAGQGPKSQSALVWQDCSGSPAHAPNEHGPSSHSVSVVQVCVEFCAQRRTLQVPVPQSSRSMHASGDAPLHCRCARMTMCASSENSSILPAETIDLLPSDWNE